MRESLMLVKIIIIIEQIELTGMCVRKIKHVNTFHRA